MAGAATYTEAGTRRGRLQALYGALKTERASFDAHWRDLSEHIVPRRSRWFAADRNRGSKRNEKIIDSTGRYAARTLQSGLHAGLTSPARPWMRLTTPDPDLAQQPDVRQWLHDVTQRMLSVFESTNLYNVLPNVYGDMGVFATAAMSILDDTENVFRVYSYPIGSYVLGQDERGLITTFMREYQRTVRQIVKQFGVREDGKTIDWSHISTTVRNLWDKANYETPVNLMWAVLPNDQADRNRIEAKYLPWASCYWEQGSQDNVDGQNGSNMFLRETGFHEFPFMCPRWDVTDEDTYGTDSPGMTALPDVKQLQQMQRKKGRAIEKLVDPPLVGPTALMNQKTSLVSGDITYVDVRDGTQGLRSIHEININLQHLVADMGETQYRIQRAFYEDLWLMLARSDNYGGSLQPITAREVDERHEEKLLALGPVLERTNDELLNPIIDRTYAIMRRKGLIPPIPNALHGVSLKVQYTSVMAEAQKLVGIAGTDRLIATVTPMVQTWPEVREKIDVDALVDEVGNILGVNPKIIRTTEVAQQRVAAAQKQQEGVMQADQAAKVAGAAKNLAATPMTGDTALTRMIGAQTGAGAGGAALAGGG